MDQPQFIAVAQRAEVQPGSAKVVTVGDRSILLCNSDDRIFAIENLCSHAEQPLECGRIRNGWIACPTHGARFDLETGEPLNPPATEPIATFPVRIRGETVEIAV